MKKITIRLDDDVEKELAYLTETFGTSMNAYINALIRAEYSRFDEDPKIKKAVEQLNELKALIDKYQEDK